jgi:hypothetical protein
MFSEWNFENQQFLERFLQGSGGEELDGDDDDTDDIEPFHILDEEQQQQPQQQPQQPQQQPQQLSSNNTNI